MKCIDIIYFGKKDENECDWLLLLNICLYPRIHQNYPLNEDLCGMNRAHISYLSNRTDEDFKLFVSMDINLHPCSQSKKLDHVPRFFFWSGSLVARIHLIRWISGVSGVRTPAPAYNNALSYQLIYAHGTPCPKILCQRWITMWFKTNYKKKNNNNVMWEPNTPSVPFY